LLEEESQRMTFKLEIRLGNDVQTGADILQILHTTDVSIPEELSVGDNGNIRDLNGNKVGEWKITR
jgi:hypothetical protein